MISLLKAVVIWMAVICLQFQPITSQFDFFGGLGVVSPSGPQYIKPNKGSFQLNCSLNAGNVLGSEYLYWGVIYTDDRAEEFFDGFIIDERTLGLKRGPPLAKSMSGEYHCYLNRSSTGQGEQTNVGLVSVKIDDPLAPVEDMVCVIHNYDYMHCKFCPATGPPDGVAWILYYTVNGGPVLKCPTSSEHLLSCQCIFSGNSSGVVWDEYVMNVTAFNNVPEYGPPAIHRVIYGFSLVKPNAVRNLEVRTVSSTELYVSWVPEGIAVALQFMGQMVYYVEYAEVGSTESKVLEVSKNTTIHDLKPYKEYTVTVYGRCERAPNNEHYWSDVTPPVINRTMATAPNYGPVVAAYKSYDCVGETDTPNCIQLYLHIQEIPDEDKNGPVIGNRAVYKAQNGAEIAQNISTPKTYSILWEVDRNVDCTITVWALTKGGQSDEVYVSPPSSVQIRRYSMWPEPIERITAETSAGNMGVNLLWEYAGEADNFTVFRCHPKGGQQRLCQTSPEHTVIAGTQSSYYIPGYDADDMYAIAVNSATGNSSGLTEWLPVCRYNAAPGTLSYEISTLGMDRSLTFTWDHVPCQLNIPVGLVLYYSLQWTDGLANGSALVAANESSYTLLIPDLVPYTEYMVGMAAHTRSQSSGLQYKNITTEQSVPEDPPHSVNMVNYTASDITLNWAAPLIPNGMVTHYLIQRMGGRFDFNESVAAPSTSHVIENLDGYTNYTVVVYAENGAGFSPASEAVTVATFIKAPAQITEVSTRVINSTKIETVWAAPVPENGPVITYVIYHNMDGEDLDPVYLDDPGERVHSLSVAELCGREPVPMNTSVAAVTRDEQGNTLYGIKSVPKESIVCEDKLAIWKIVVITIACGGALFAVILLVLWPGRIILNRRLDKQPKPELPESLKISNFKQEKYEKQDSGYHENIDTNEHLITDEVAGSDGDIMENGIYKPTEVTPTIIRASSKDSESSTESGIDSETARNGGMDSSGIGSSAPDSAGSSGSSDGFYQSGKSELGSMHFDHSGTPSEIQLMTSAPFRVDSAHGGHINIDEVFVDKKVKQDGGVGDASVVIPLGVINRAAEGDNNALVLNLADVVLGGELEDHDTDSHPQLITSTNTDISATTGPSLSSTGGFTSTGSTDSDYAGAAAAKHTLSDNTLQLEKFLTKTNPFADSGGFLDLNTSDEPLTSADAGSKISRTLSDDSAVHSLDFIPNNINSLNNDAQDHISNAEGVENDNACNNMPTTLPTIPGCGDLEGENCMFISESAHSPLVINLGDSNNLIFKQPDTDCNIEICESSDSEVTTPDIVVDSGGSAVNVGFNNDSSGSSGSDGYTQC